MVETTWYYADVQAVLDLLGAANLRVVTDLGSEDEGRGNRYNITIVTATGGTFDIVLRANGTEFTVDGLNFDARPDEVQDAISEDTGELPITVTQSGDGLYTIYFPPSLGSDAGIVEVNNELTDVGAAITFARALGDLSDDELAIIVRDGQTADAFIDAALASGVYTVPLVVGGVAPADLPTTNRMRLVMRRISSLYTAVLLNEHRSVLYTGGEEFDTNKYFRAYQRQVDTMLGQIAGGVLALGADATGEAGDLVYRGGSMAALRLDRGHPPGTVSSDDV